MGSFFKFYGAIIGRAEKAELQIIFQALAVNTTCKVDIYAKMIFNPGGSSRQAQMCGQPYLCIRKLNEPNVPKIPRCDYRRT